MLHVINDLSQASGLQLNFNKSELFALKDQSTKSICNLKVNRDVKYLFRHFYYYI